VSQAAELVNKQFPSADAEGIKCDVSKEADVKAAIDRAVEKWGRLDVLVSRRVSGSVSPRSAVQVCGNEGRIPEEALEERVDDTQQRALVGS
jgi:NAD(P)-dependent dehydrogenase (short-subunit alcohol dehydrogenase family)